MKHAEKVWYHGRCDRECHRVTKHPHLATDPYRGTLEYRPRLPSFTLEGHGGEFNDLMSVQELITRLQQCPPDARVSLEYNELTVATRDNKIATVLNNYDSSQESFDGGNRLRIISFPNTQTGN